MSLLRVRIQAFSLCRRHAEVEQTEEAMDIMYELTQIYQRGE